MTIKELRTTGEYNQIFIRIYDLVGISSGSFPIPSAAQIADDLIVEVRPAFKNGKSQIGWSMIVSKKNESSMFGCSELSRIVMSKKKGKFKAAQVFTDAIFEDLMI